MKLMKSLCIWSGVGTLLLYSIALHAQTTQTIRGSVTDNITNAPLIGVNVVVISAESLLGSATDADGNYRINGVPLGRHTLKVSYIGYEEQYIPNVVVTAGKEVILNITLTENVSQLNTVVVTANSKDDKTATNNELAMVSARSFNVDDTKRYAGALGGSFAHGSKLCRCDRWR